MGWAATNDPILKGLLQQTFQEQEADFAPENDGDTILRQLECSANKLLTLGA